MSDATSDLLSLPRLARRLNVPARWLRVEADAGRIPCIRAGARYLFDVAAVQAALSSQARGGHETSTMPNLDATAMKRARERLAVAVGRVLRRRGVSDAIVLKAAAALLGEDIADCVAHDETILVIEPDGLYPGLLSEVEIAMVVEKLPDHDWSKVVTADIRTAWERIVRESTA